MDDNKIVVSMKEKIINLRKKGWIYDQISKELGISKATISYHLKNTELDGTLVKKIKITPELIRELNEFYSNHTLKECSEKFKISRSTVVKYVKNKFIERTQEEKNERNYQRVKSYRQRMKERLVNYKGGKCQLCGYNLCITALEFHHLNSKDKDFTVSKYSNLKWDTVVSEVDKCIMVCANCHREIHAGLRDVSPLPDKE